MNTNLTTFADLYQFTMMYGYYKTGKMDEEVAFDLFFRKNPFHNGYTIAAGLETVIQYIQNLSFTDSDIDYLKSTGLFQDENFFDYLQNLSFTGDLYAMPEGTVVFPNEPLIKVRTRLFEAQFIETALLTQIGHQSLIATKANRMTRVANGKPILEFGARRAQGVESAVLGSRASIIGGCNSTSNVKAGKEYDLMISGTHAHSWIMSFDSELEAFQSYAEAFPDHLILLIDTFDTLKSGMPNAIKVFREVKKQHGELKTYGVRLDSGDLAYLSKKAREMLDEAGFQEAIIVASNDLDEYTIRELESQEAKIDAYGVGTKLITAYDQPALGCVYKLAAEKLNDKWIPKIKRSENPEKITNPGLKKVLRYIDEKNGEALVDLIMLEDEQIPNQPFEVFDPIHTWKRKKVKHCKWIELLQPIFIQGKLVYESPSINEIVENVQRNLSSFSKEHKRFSKPHIYHVDLSQNLWDMKMKLLAELD
ncbi:nicotinate phosphoribosyltransferase [Chengkuizengella axinellae]|uniref:Nicotinate phosphoribosyltransferase n=1 Tax=Chengkuizengella axinellae TaxID=3064388 RepID=A0ABT9IUF6_9BACL|nr:nicotinate phosphoribosyltransferase [Chengkuizengella sp. 2205SS18-9]MDP5272986.1 nicotinate phosphoribosyltransferase [Chengkuizengella sp. 2205SS18-9]